MKRLHEAQVAVAAFDGNGFRSGSLMVHAHGRNYRRDLVSFNEVYARRLVWVGMYGFVSN